MVHANGASDAVVDVVDIERHHFAAGIVDGVALALHRLRHLPLLVGGLDAVTRVSTTNRAGHRGKRIFVATKVPPKNREWPSRPGVPFGEVFPRAYVREYVDISRSNLGGDTIDLLQLHVWDDNWLASGELKQTIAELKREVSIRAFGLSLNRREPWNGIAAVRSGLVDSVQVVYNVFDQSAEDELFPACRENNVAVVARCPFDEGSLIGNLTLRSTWPAGDWRSGYFGPNKCSRPSRHASSDTAPWR